MDEARAFFSGNRNDVKKIMRKIQADKCPNFFLYGESLCMLEQQSINLAKQLEQKCFIRYQGIVKSFTILMPYYETVQEAKKFLNHLNYSLKIARDFYEKFCGTILIEMDSKWAEYGENSALHFFADYMRKKPEICFILLLSGTRDTRGNMEKIGWELSSAGIWMRLPMESPDVDICVGQFCKMANKKGFYVPERTKKALYDQLDKRCEADIDNMEASRLLLEQIIFQRSMTRNCPNIIEPEDIQGMSGVQTDGAKNNEPARPIGFMSNL